MAKHDRAAKDILQTFEDVLDEMDMKHETNEDDFRIHFYYQGEDMRHRMNISIDPERANFRLVIVLPFDILSEKAQHIIYKLKTYCEYSPSEAGLRCIRNGKQGIRSG